MKAYMLKSDKRIEPFGDHPGDCLLTNRRLRDIQEEVLNDLDLELVTTTSTHSTIQEKDPDEHITFDDSLLFTKELLQEFIDISRRLKRCTICALKPGLFTLRSVVATQEVQVFADRIEYGLRYAPTRQYRGGPVPVVIKPEQFVEAVPFPVHVFGEPEFLTPMTDKVLLQVNHWINLWWGSGLLSLAKAARIRKTPKLRLMPLALKARSINQWKVARQLDKIGRNCDIHPTAYVEFSTIGSNVIIGAGSIVRNSLIGDYTYIQNNATVYFSTLGERCHINNGTVVYASVFYPGVFAGSRLVSASLCGRDCFIAGGVTLPDFRLDGKNITVMKDGVEIDTGNKGGGSCLGHGVYLGSGCIVAPGRSIPNGLRISPEESRIIRRIAPDGTIEGYRRIDVDTGSVF